MEPWFSFLFPAFGVCSQLAAVLLDLNIVISFGEVVIVKKIEKMKERAAKMFVTTRFAFDKSKKEQNYIFPSCMQRYAAMPILLRRIMKRHLMI